MDKALPLPILAGTASLLHNVACSAVGNEPAPLATQPVTPVLRSSRKKVVRYEAEESSVP